MIYVKQTEINEEWTQLNTKATIRKEKLLDSYDLQRFLSDYRDLMSWISSMKGNVGIWRENRVFFYTDKFIIGGKFELLGR